MARDGVPPECGRTQRRPTNGREMDRREFLQKGMAATVGVAALGAVGTRALAAEPPKIERRVVLGRTGLEISDIGFGSGALEDDPALVSYAFERGITYFDSAESYPMFKNGIAERTIGEALRGKRDRVVLTSKTVAKAGERRAVFRRRLEASLRRLGTDYIDVYFNHAVNEVERMQNPEWLEFVAEARKAGKIRFSGMSGHGGHLIECLDFALDHDLVDVILVAHNFGQDPAFYERFTRSFDIVANQEGLPRVLAKAHSKKVGVVAMKTLMGAKLNDMRPYEWPGSTFAQAAFRWVLSQPDVDALIVSMKSREMIDEYVAASGKGKLRESDRNLLERYALLHTGSYCRPACNACEAACPEGVPISEVLRTRMYAADYGEPRRARAEYARLETNASACVACSHQRCLGACPHGIDVPARTRSTHRMLSSS